MTRIPGFLLAVALGIAACAPAHAQFEVGYAHVDEIDGQTSQAVHSNQQRDADRPIGHRVVQCIDHPDRE